MRLFGIPPQHGAPVIAAVLSPLAQLFWKGLPVPRRTLKSSRQDFESGPWDETTEASCKVVNKMRLQIRESIGFRPRQVLVRSVPGHNKSTVRSLGSIAHRSDVEEIRTHSSSLQSGLTENNVSQSRKKCRNPRSPVSPGRSSLAA